MANTVSIISYANTFGDWVTSSIGAAIEINSIGESNWTKDNGTLTLNGGSSSGVPSLVTQYNAVVGGQLQVQGTGSSAYVQNNLTVGGLVQLTNTAQSLYTYGSANVQGQLYAGGAGVGLVVANNTQLNGSISVGGTSTTNGVATFAGSGNGIVVANNALINGNISVIGNEVVTGNVTVTGTTSLNGQANTNNNLGVGGSLYVAGNEVIIGNETVTGTTTMVGTANTTNNLGVGSNLYVTGNTTHTGTTTMVGQANTTNNLGVGSNLYVTGNTTHTGTTTMVGQANTTNNLGVGANLYVTGNTTHTGTTTMVGQANTTNNLGVGSNLYVTGNEVVTGNSTVSGNKTITGTTSLVGQANTTNNLGVGANLYVTGNEVVTGSVTVAGTTSLQGSSNVANMAVGGNLYVPNLLFMGNNTSSANIYTLTIPVGGSLNVNGNFVQNAPTIYNSPTFTLSSASPVTAGNYATFSAYRTGANAAIRWDETNQYWGVVNVASSIYYRILSADLLSNAINSSNTQLVASASAVSSAVAYAANASNITSGTIPNAQLPTNISVSTVTTSGNIAVNGGVISGVTTLPSGVTAPGMLGSSSPAVVAAGTTQGTATALTSDVNYISSGTGGVVLQGAVAGKYVVVVNRSSSAINIYPATGHILDTLSANSPISLPANGYLEAYGSATGQWNTTANALINGSMVVGSINGVPVGNSTASTGAFTSLTATTLAGNGASLTNLAWVNVTGAPAFITSSGAPVQSVGGNTGTVTAAQIASAATTGYGFTPYSNANPSGYITSSGAPVQSVGGNTGTVTNAQLAASVTASYGSAPVLTVGGVTATTISNTQIASAATTGYGFTPYSNANPSGYQTASGTVTNVSGSGTISAASATLTGTVSAGTLSGTHTGNGASLTNLSWSNVSGAPAFITSSGAPVQSVGGNIGTISNTQIASAATTGYGYTPYSSTNPSNYITTSASITGTATNITAYTINQNVGISSNVQFMSIGVGTTPDTANTGSIRAINNITAYYSDDRLKTRTGNIENAINKVMSLDAFYYEPNEVAQALGYSVTQEVGISAQQVQAIMPQVVAPAPIDEQYLTVRYERLVPLLIAAIKELKIEIDVLKNGK